MSYDTETAQFPPGLLFLILRATVAAVVLSVWPSLSLVPSLGSSASRTLYAKPTIGGKEDHMAHANLLSFPLLQTTTPFRPSGHTRIAGVKMPAQINCF